MTQVQTPLREPKSQDFHALDLAFLGSLLPGIIHNWATPLSGVIGATQLLERRVSVIEDLLKGFDQLTLAERDELRKQLERNRTNVEILSRNAKHLADQLQILVYRITRGSGVARDCFPLNELMQNELRFLEANLQFKHKVRKNLALDPATPATAFCYGFVAAAIDEYVTYVISQHDYSQRVLEMSFTTASEHDIAQLVIEAHFAPALHLDPGSNSLEVYLTRLREDGWTADFTRETDKSNLTLKRPQRQATP